MCFGDVSFSPPGRHLDAQGARKGAEREPKVIEKEVRRHLVEHAKTMAGTVREAYGEVPGRVQETLFSERGTKASPEGSREGSGTIFHDFGSPLGTPWGTILRKSVFFSGADFWVTFGSLWGGAGGRGLVPLGFIRLPKATLFPHALYPKGWGRI